MRCFDLLKLISNELYRTVISKSTWLITISIIILVAIFTLIIDKSSPNQSNENWKQEISTQIVSAKEDMNELSPSVPMYQYLKEQIAINEYRLENDIAPSTKYNVWTLMVEIGPITTYLALIAIIFAATSIALEHSRGTIKFITTSPNSRWKILTSKYLTILLVLTILIVGTILLSFGFGYFFLGTDGNDHYLTYSNGEVMKESMVAFLTKNYAATWLNIAMMCTLAFMISVIFRNAIISVGVSLFIFFTGSAITTFLANQFEWVKYLLFANSNLLQYIDGEPPVEGMTIEFSIIVMACYYIIFMVLSYLTFLRRDVTT